MTRMVVELASAAAGFGSVSMTVVPTERSPLEVQAEARSASATEKAMILFKAR